MRMVVSITSAEEFGDCYYKAFRPDMLREWNAHKKRKRQQEKAELKRIMHEEQARKEAWAERKAYMEALNRRQQAKMRRQPPPWDKELLKEWYVEQRLSMKEIAGRMFCCERTVQKNLTRFGIKRGRPPVKRPSLDPEEVRRLYLEEDLTVRNLCDRFGVSFTILGNFMKEHGIRKRKEKAGYDDEEILRLFREEGWSFEQIARKYNVCGASMKSYMERRGFIRRDQ